MITNFVGDIKQQMFYQLWKFKLDTLINNYFIIKKIVYGIVTVKLHNVIIFPCYFLYFNTLLAGYTEVKYQLKSSFFMNIKFDEL